ncbi:sigma-70 family RNA polymerase sigma factor [Lentibacillus daqui]|uniref:sigma-70 family RNA polymerase sigma factor n=1 Tax=Lentibacillus daqui TaxID=2911514 RepID=UPI0022B0F3D2|nr:sigma-70 family RNA polymerase sigma factor [Lentibacillus daqui]
MNKKENSLEESNNGENSNEKKTSFEEIFKQNERRIHYHIHRLHIQDPHNEFFVEGLYAMWCAYKKYKPDQGVMSTYFNFTIRNRLIDMLRKKKRENQHQETFVQHEKLKIDNGNRDCKTNLPIPDTTGIEVQDEAFWKKMRGMLTDNQSKWVKYHVIEGLPLAEIAEQEGVTVDAVKSWGKTARKKLKSVGVRELLE